MRELEVSKFVGASSPCYDVSVKPRRTDPVKETGNITFKTPKNSALILQCMSTNSVYSNAQTVGAPPCPTLRPLCNPPIGLHPCIASPCNPALWPEPTRSSQPRTIASRTLHHCLRRPQSCYRAGHAGLLLAGHA